MYTACLIGVNILGQKISTLLNISGSKGESEEQKIKKRSENISPHKNLQ